jgi:hypothetical protein
MSDLIERKYTFIEKNIKVHTKKITLIPKIPQIPVQMVGSPF